ncbi:MAG: Xaa-Pro aminopeptidase [Myxococcales bacterium]|nr:Xaa-Pro aminopeptidase [Myxococcales bacterium]
MARMLKPSVFAKHRAAFMEAMGPNSVALVGSPPELLRNGDASYSYRQCSDLYYLSGFAEPGATVVLRTEGDSPYTLFVRSKDPEREIWDGRRSGVEGAIADYGASQAFSNKELRSKLRTLISNVDNLYYELGSNPVYDKLVIELLGELRQGERRGVRPPLRIVDPRFTLHELRLRKSEEELAVLRKASELTAVAHIEAMRAASSGVSESEIEAGIDFSFRRHGGTGPGYTSIVGGGANATILHYIENNQELSDGDLVLIDAGCEYQFYTADITRTFPVNGTFSDAQKRCYEIVLDSQEQAIAMTKPGVTIDEIHDRCVQVLTAGMIELGLLEGTVAERIEDGSYKKFYMHRTSHWLGMDVHDVGPYSVDGVARPLEPGMVITVEPGLYISADAENIPEELRGIGIRIEDDLVVTAEGNENLSTGVPKTVREIEAACQS